MMPVVFSFVCLNNNFADDTPCFGEVWLRRGSLEAPRGAVAFIGNGDSAPLHNAAYDFDDDASPIGAAFWSRLVETALPPR